MGDVLLILGNGFDLDLGFKTRFSDFASSEYWPKFGPAPTVLQRYLEVRKDIDKWFDLEGALLDYSQRLNEEKADPHTPSEDIVFFRCLKEHIMDYLENEQNKPIMKGSVAARLLCGLLKTDNLKSIYTFNYTNIKRVASNFCQQPDEIDVNYVHGSLDKRDIIVGVDESEVIEGYEFLQKAVDVNYHSTNIISEFSLSQNIIFFGHSFGKIDIEYFKPFFNFIFNQNIQEDQHHPHITIFTYDEESRLEILKNIHSMGINRQRLFNLCDFNIYRTKKGLDDDKINAFINSFHDEEW